MTAESQPAGIKLQALLLADAIYRDEGSGKYVIAGVFHQINLPSFPAAFARSVGIFASLSGLDAEAAVDIEFSDAQSGEVLMRLRSFPVSGIDPDLPVEFAVEVPPLAFPHPGSYKFSLLANGAFLGAATVLVKSPEEGQ